MSYNISRWITKKVVDLRIPLYVFIEDTEGGTSVDVNAVTLETTVQVDEMDGFTGKLDQSGSDAMLMVDTVELGGEGSGWAFHDVVIPALELSTGVLEAVAIWEGGDKITRLTVKDGKVTQEEIEL